MGKPTTVGSSPTPTTKNTNTRCVNALSTQVLDVEIVVFFVVGWRNGRLSEYKQVVPDN